MEREQHFLTFAALRPSEQRFLTKVKKSTSRAGKDLSAQTFFLGGQMNAILKHSLLVGGLAIAAQATAQVTLYEHPGFRGQSFNAERPIGNLERSGFNNRGSSAIVRGESWEVCDGPGFSGRCALLRPASIPRSRDGLE
jgi:hypothetical protein